MIAGLELTIICNLWSKILTIWFQLLTIQIENVNDEFPEYIDLDSNMLTLGKKTNMIMLW